MGSLCHGFYMMTEPTENLLLRPMQPDDLPEVMAIENRCHSAPWGERVFRAELAASHAQLTVCSIDGAIAGYLCWWLIAGEMEIQNVATDPGWQRRGIGRALVVQALAAGRAAGATRALLEVRVGNAGAIALYRSFGFTDSGIRKRYYADGEDALLMELDLCLEPGIEPG